MQLYRDLVWLMKDDPLGLLTGLGAILVLGTLFGLLAVFYNRLMARIDARILIPLEDRLGRWTRDIGAELMGNKRKMVLLGTAVSMLLACLFPPWRMMVRNSMSIWEGFAFLLKPPSPPLSTVDVGFLFLELVAIGLLGSIVWILLGKDSR